jgi:Leucine-rich repeat (LRR) protein
MKFNNILLKSVTIVIVCILTLLIIQKNYFINIEGKCYFAYSKILILQDNSISNDDIEQLKKFKHLKEIRIYGTNISTLDFMNNMNNLEKVSFLGSSTHIITNLAPIQECNTLKELTIHDVCVDDLNNISNLKELEYLDLSFCNINHILDISALDGLTSLKTIRLTNTKINDISVISNLNCLETLIISKKILSKEEIALLKNHNIVVVEI